MNADHTADQLEQEAAANAAPLAHCDAAEVTRLVPRGQTPPRPSLLEALGDAVDRARLHRTR